MYLRVFQSPSKGETAREAHVRVGVVNAGAQNCIHKVRDAALLRVRSQAPPSPRLRGIVKEKAAGAGPSRPADRPATRSREPCRRDL